MLFLINNSMNEKESKSLSDNVSQEELIQMIIRNQNKSGDGISISPMTAVIGMSGALVVLIQFMVGLAVWSMQDRLDRYDQYESRITTIENNVVKLDRLAEDVSLLITEFKLFSKTERFDTTDFQTNIQPFRIRLETLETYSRRFEDRVLKRLDKLEEIK